MAADERLTDLKKAYADIILNTAKEAAARIMSSERNARRFERELQVAKDEALRMLLRLKQMMDSKISEAELTSLSQQRKIDELEAQLQEAEDIVKDLREELRAVQSELEWVKNDRLQVDGCHGVAGGQVSEDDKYYASESVTCPHYGTGYEYVANGDLRNANHYQRNEFHEFYGAVSILGKPYIGCPDLPSILLRSKEPELYRNGCTQRIRASEGKLLGGGLSLSMQINETKDGISAQENERGKETVTGTTFEKENPENVDKNIRELDSGLGNWQHSFVVKRKRANRYRKHRITSPTKIPGQSLGAPEACNISSVENHPIPVNNVHSDGNALEMIQKLYSDKAESHDTSGMKIPGSDVCPDGNALQITSSNKAELGPESSCVGVTESVSEPSETAGFENPIDETTTMEKVVHEGQGAGSTECLAIPVEETNTDKVNLLPNSESNECNVANSASRQPMIARIIKFTFHRKRKKGSVNRIIGSSSVEEETSKRPKLDETSSSPMEIEKLNIMTEPAQDNQQQLQVTHQIPTEKEKSNLVTGSARGSQQQLQVARQVPVEKENSTLVTELARDNRRQVQGSRHVEKENSTLVTELARDTRRQAQGARQLIYLSERKWWW